MVYLHPPTFVKIRISFPKKGENFYQFRVRQFGKKLEQMSVLTKVMKIIWHHKFKEKIKYLLDCRGVGLAFGSSGKSLSDKIDLNFSATNVCALFNCLFGDGVFDINFASLLL